MVGYQLFFQQAEFNFPLLLVLLVFGSGIIWLFDALYLQKKRRALVSRVGDEVGEVGEELQDRYREVEAVLGREPLEVEYSKSFFPVLFIVLVLRSFLVEPFQIPSESMVPTLEVGDFILVNKFTYGIRLPVIRTKVLDINEPKRGEVMVFFPPHKKQYFIKRVIGLPGDEILYVNKVLYINGEKMPQQLVASLPPANPRFQIMRESLDGVEHAMRKHVTHGQPDRKRSWVVPEGHYFMMGDNRDNSADSREWGVVPEENIVGRAFGIWMHWEGLLSLPSFSRVGSIQ
ncbi:signal peptidase I [Exilibacterium tricleocarpae]|uniref:Signal peptidase I n=1 Tax=Exilibacterium tricleocarpae TaxID=2591008 RepID=A0A545U4B6_9GAMM|nr:signal peptidase I [Exilibacterium tricleocarpae]TQV84308.1 signal peptidase I [Exilibacterium tricleocarpae]